MRFLVLLVLAFVCGCTQAEVAPKLGISNQNDASSHHMNLSRRVVEVEGAREMRQCTCGCGTGELEEALLNQLVGELKWHYLVRRQFCFLKAGGK